MQEYLIFAPQSVGISKNTESVLCLSCWAPCCPALFSPCGDVPDLDQLCLSTSAVHKGSRGKLFILTSFRENKPSALGACFPPYRSEKQRRGCPDGQQLSLCRHYRPGPVSGPAGPEQVCRRRLQVLHVKPGQLVQPYRDIKITPHGAGYSCPSTL